MRRDAQTSTVHDLAAGYPFAEPRLLRPAVPELLLSAASPAIAPEEGVISEALYREIREDVRRIRYHEAGHAVALYWYGFRPAGIYLDETFFDRRTIRFLTGSIPSLATCTVRERAAEFAVCTIAGIAAESRIIGKPLESLRRTTGSFDYQVVSLIVDSTFRERQYEFAPSVAASQVQCWEARAVALMGQKPLWAAVKSVVAGLRKCSGILTEEQTVTAIQRVLGPGARRKDRTQ